VRSLVPRLAIATALVLALGAAALALGRPALAVPSPMTWSDYGTRGEQTGTFTASEPLCPSGTFKDIAFVGTCMAIADFDNTAPSARIKTLRLSRVGRAYKMHLTFATADNVAGNAVSFKIEAVAAGRRIGGKAGQTAGGTLEIALTVRPPKRARRVAVSLRVADPLGNARTVGRSSSLPH
jgi:hypothetical protein